MMRDMEVRLIDKDENPWEVVYLDFGLDRLQRKLVSTNLLVQLEEVENRFLHKEIISDVVISWRPGDTGYRDIIIHMNRKQAYEMIQELTDVKAEKYNLHMRGVQIH